VTEGDYEIQRHPGWKFLLVTISDIELQELDKNFSSTISIETIQAYLQKLYNLFVVDESVDILLPLLWVGYVATLRLLVEGDATAEKGLSEMSLINAAYSLGVTSFENDKSARHFLLLQNIALQSVVKVVNAEDCRHLRQMIDETLNRVVEAQRVS
jgi:hypothetical protein